MMQSSTIRIKRKRPTTEVFVAKWRDNNTLSFDYYTSPEALKIDLQYTVRPYDILRFVLDVPSHMIQSTDKEPKTRHE